MIGIYKISNNIDNRVYIGQSINIYSRWAQHEAKLRLKQHDSYKLQTFYDNNLDSIKLKFDVLEMTDDKSKLNELEDKWVRYYDSLNNGFNVANVGGNKNNKIKNQKNRINGINTCYSFINCLGRTKNTCKLDKFGEYIKEIGLPLIIQGIIDDDLAIESNNLLDELKSAIESINQDMFSFIKNNIGAKFQKINGRWIFTMVIYYRYIIDGCMLGTTIIYSTDKNKSQFENIKEYFDCIPYIIELMFLDLNNYNKVELLDICPISFLMFETIGDEI